MLAGRLDRCCGNDEAVELVAFLRQHSFVKQSLTGKNDSKLRFVKEVYLVNRFING